jgi:hypothetical protein
MLVFKRILYFENLRGGIKMGDDNEVRRIILRKPKTLVQSIYTSITNIFVKVRNFEVWNWLRVKIDAMDWEDAWGVLFFSIVIVIACVLFRLVTADHKVECYYVKMEWQKSGQKNSMGGDILVPMYTIRSYVPWSEDKDSFASDNINDTLALLRTLPQCTSKSYPIEPKTQ